AFAAAHALGHCLDARLATDRKAFGGHTERLQSLEQRSRPRRVCSRDDQRAPAQHGHCLERLVQAAWTKDDAACRRELEFSAHGVVQPGVFQPATGGNRLSYWVLERGSAIMS